MLCVAVAFLGIPFPQFVTVALIQFVVLLISSALDRQRKTMLDAMQSWRDLRPNEEVPVFELLQVIF